MWSLWDHKILIGNAKQEGDCTLEGGILREPWFPYFCAKCIFDCTMTDTRKKASRGDYEKEQEISKGYLEYFGNPENFIGKPSTTYHPGNGLIGAKVNKMDLANNTLAIESMLRGTGSANMVNPMEPVKPDIKYIKTLNLYDKYVYLPDPFVHHKGERPTWQ